MRRLNLIGYTSWLCNYGWKNPILQSLMGSWIRQRRATKKNTCNSFLFPLISIDFFAAKCSCSPPADIRHGPMRACISFHKITAGCCKQLFIIQICQIVLGAVYLTVYLRDFGGETRQWRLNQHPIPIDVAQLFTYFSTILYSGC